MSMPKDGENEENVAKVSNKCVIKVGHEQSSVPKNVTRSRSGSSYEDTFLPNTNGIHLHSILKHITTFDEKNVLHCLDLVRNYALRASAPNFASKVEISPDDWTNLARTKIIGPHDMAKPNSPLSKKFGSTDFDFNFRVKNILKPVYAGFPNALHEPSNSSKAENKVVVFNHKKMYRYQPGHKRAVSISSTNTSFSDKSSSSESATSFQGILQCTWKDGIPNFIFNVDDKTEVYAASLSKAEPSGDKGFDYIYTFCSRIIGKKGLDDQEFEPQSLCTMKVSTSITLCLNSSSEVKETRFDLSISGQDHFIDELQNLNYYRKRSQGLVSKVAKVFRSSQLYKQRPSCKILGSCTFFEDSTWDPCEITEKRSENDYTPNLDAAAIIVKDTFKKNSSNEDSIGGWGLKFLKKSGNDVSLKTISPSEYMGNYVKCSTSLDVLIPVGIHGWPKTGGGGGGPSSLVERWASGGVCDCGGWDMGCPLTVLTMGPSGPNSSSLVDNLGDCKSVDLFIQGSKRDVPIFQMTNVREGLYCIHFQPTLSTLQSFAIAAAIIHTRSPAHRSKMCRT